MRRLEEDIIIHDPVGKPINVDVESWQQHQRHGFGVLGKPTTEFAGFRRLIPSEIVQLEEGTFVLITIPPASSRGDSATNTNRKAFRDRLCDAVVRSVPNELSDGLPATSKLIRERALEYLKDHNGLIRNGVKYVEVACKIARFPHRHDYIS